MKKILCLIILLITIITCSQVKEIKAQGGAATILEPSPNDYVYVTFTMEGILPPDGVLSSVKMNSIAADSVSQWYVLNNVYFSAEFIDLPTGLYTLTVTLANDSQTSETVNVSSD